MADELQDRRIAFLIANEGAEQIELTEPWQAVQRAGGQPVLVAPKPGEAQAFNHLEKGDTFKVDMTVADAKGQQFDGLVLPGGVANPDRLRTIPEAVQFARSFFENHKPVAVICHGAWTLVEADVVRGRTLTSWPSLQTDIRNAGGTWVDQEVMECTAGPNRLVSSRKPADLPAFCNAIVKAFHGVTAGASG